MGDSGDMPVDNDITLATPAARPPRRTEFDWLRAVIIALLVPYHTALLFGGGGYILGTQESSAPLGHLVHFLAQWIMPTLFILAGAAVCYALRVRTTGRYALERVKRLFIPLAFGTFVVVPPQVYCRRLADGVFEGSYFAWYPHFFEGIWPNGNLTWIHLWFIAYLFVYSLVALPAFLLLRRPAGQRFIDRLAACCDRPGAVFLFAVPIALTECLLHPRFPWTWALYGDWAMLAWHLWHYLIGFILASDDRFWRAIRRAGPAALVFGAIIYGFETIIYRFELWPEHGYNVANLAFLWLRAFGSWFWTVAALAVALRFLRRDHRLLPYVRDASYPSYILHQTPLVIIAHFIIYTDTPLALRFTLLTLATIPVTLALYELAIRRWPPMRFLFGLRPRPAKD